ncbi:MAG TPA: ATP-dependent RNA helicase DbpA [Kofleriaceae bacterium]|jgi:ATP-independent RNA helicase DbpA|nr:ATP-dependent RNA helicase DbpA [Kofleriaceae bacterium]
MSLAFSTLPLAPSWLANLAQLEYREMTPIQALALPAMLAGRDVLGQAGTGTGKTCAFGLALLARITPRAGRPGALVLCPTRELAAQVAEELRRLARPLPHTRVLTLSGGSSIQRERASLAHGVDVVVGTPGRVQDHLARGRLALDAIATVVLDEADRMLEMGFLEPVTAIVGATPADRQTLLFSATFPDAVRAMSASFQRAALHVTAPAGEAAGRATLAIYDVGAGDRTAALIRILGHHQPASSVIFCNHRETCDGVAEALAAAGFSAVALHGGMDQHDRNTVLLLLKNGSLRVVVATDVAARGLDIEQLGAVINYDLPHDPDVLVHRIGRTARAGHAGLAISLTGPGDRRALDDLRHGPLAGVPTTPLPTAGEGAAGAPPPAMVTLAIQGGRHDRLRPGDLVGALTTGLGIAAADIGQISIQDRISFVALSAAVAPRALAGINGDRGHRGHPGHRDNRTDPANPDDRAGRIKNKRFRAYLVTAPRPPGHLP